VLVRQGGVAWFVRTHVWQLTMYGLGVVVTVAIGLLVGSL
jgi:hypothetical protein